MLSPRPTKVQLSLRCQLSFTTVLEFWLFQGGGALLVMGVPARMPATIWHRVETAAEKVCVSRERETAKRELWVLSLVR